MFVTNVKREYTGAGMIEYRNHITRQMLRDEPDKLFVFGDNMERRGLGGQAKEMRGEPNAVGIATKWRPTMDDDAFLSDDDKEQWAEASTGDILKVVEFDGVVVWPTAGIGTGRARLLDKAPKIAKLLDIVRRMVEAKGQ